MNLLSAHSPNVENEEARSVWKPIRRRLGTSHAHHCRSLRRSRHRRLSVETLETRQLLAADGLTLLGDDVLKLGSVGFNPQPEPPVDLQAAMVAGDGNDIMSFVGNISFNPQPEPPVDLQAAMVARDENDIMSFVGNVSFNPQPEPPVDLTHVTVAKEGRAGDDTQQVDRTALRPAALRLSSDGGSDNDAINSVSRLGFNPQPEPPHILSLRPNGGIGDDDIGAKIDPIDIDGLSQGEI